MNFVLRTLLRWVLERHIGRNGEIRNEEIEYERKDKEMREYRILLLSLSTINQLNLSNMYYVFKFG